MRAPSTALRLVSPLPMANRHFLNPFEEDEVKPFFGAAPASSGSRLSNLPPEPAGFNYNHDASIDITTDSAAESKNTARALQRKESELRRREQDVKRREDAAAGGSGILAAIDVVGDNTIVGTYFYFMGFGFFWVEILHGILVLQQVYTYFRGSGQAAEMKREAARGALRAATS